MLKLSLTLLFLSAGASVSYAAVSLSVTPANGGNSLRFADEFDQAQEVKIRVTSTGGSRYQIFQRLIDPLTNDKGQNLNQQALHVQALVNSNTSGTLYMQNKSPMRIGEEILYTSGPNGESDSFTLGYFLERQAMNAAGNFRGKIMFSVRSFGDGSTDQALIDVFIENGNQWKVEVKGGHASNQVRIKDSDTQNNADYVRISFSGNSGDVRIYQEMETALQNESGEELPEDALIVHNSSAEGFDRSTSSLKTTRTLVYTSRKADDEVMLSFMVNPDKTASLAAGKYFGRIKYIIESDGGVEYKQIDLHVNVQSIFTIDIKPPEDGLSYNRILPLGEPQFKEFTITVRSNLKKPYQVMQGFDMPLTNEQGAEFNNRYFTFKVDVPGDQRGKTRFGDFSPVTKGEKPVFTSDGQGSSSTFKLLYKLEGYSGMEPGKFHVPVRFSLNQN